MIRVRVDGMTCGHCEQAVAKALAAVPGVQRVVRVCREEGAVVIEGSPDHQALVYAIENEGYEAEVMV